MTTLPNRSLGTPVPHVPPPPPPRGDSGVFYEHGQAGGRHAGALCTLEHLPAFRILSLYCWSSFFILF